MKATTFTTTYFAAWLELSTRSTPCVSNSIVALASTLGVVQLHVEWMLSQVAIHDVGHVINFTCHPLSQERTSLLQVCKLILHTEHSVTCPTGA